MKRFLFQFLIFIAPICLMAYWLDGFISNNLKKSNKHAQKEFPTWNAIMDGNLDADLLIYGSSRAWVHFDPQIMEDSLKQKVYNIGIDGLTFNMQYLRHLLVLENNRKPKTIIYSLDVGSLQKGNFYNPDQYLPYMLESPLFYKFLSEYNGYSFWDFKIPLIRYYGKYEALKATTKMVLFPNKNPIERIKGYQGQEIEWNGDFDKAKKQMDQYSVAIDSSTLKLFDSFINQCHHLKIELILVYSPMYIEGQNFIQNKEEINAIYTSLAQKYNLTFLDFTNDSICYDKSFFYNAMHMNKNGANHFTKKLCTKLKEIKNN